MAQSRQLSQFLVDQLDKDFSSAVQESGHTVVKKGQIMLKKSPGAHERV